ncbi:hypothetical protein EC973_002586 [Apophysomyces ossiformis]|uniref:Uncharacterized protein n=1 Tax=Apophysomyces ossiformis TaxID=679940 RepID=A0A8H7ENK0_9FUNG|nr:hypothetical protein EC973_002586 [Apophysomyces ossiformis]
MTGKSPKIFEKAKLEQEPPKPSWASILRGPPKPEISIFKQTITETEKEKEREGEIIESEGINAKDTSLDQPTEDTPAETSVKEDLVKDHVKETEEVADKDTEEEMKECLSNLSMSSTIPTDGTSEKSEKCEEPKIIKKSIRKLNQLESVVLPIGPSSTLPDTLVMHFGSLHIANGEEQLVAETEANTDAIEKGETRVATPTEPTVKSRSLPNSPVKTPEISTLQQDAAIQTTEIVQFSKSDDSTVHNDQAACQPPYAVEENKTIRYENRFTPNGSDVVNTGVAVPSAPEYTLYADMQRTTAMSYYDPVNYHQQPSMGLMDPYSRDKFIVGATSHVLMPHETQAAIAPATIAIQPQQHTANYGNIPLYYSYYVPPSQYPSYQQPAFAGKSIYPVYGKLEHSPYHEYASYEEMIQAQHQQIMAHRDHQGILPQQQGHYTPAAASKEMMHEKPPSQHPAIPVAATPLAMYPYPSFQQPHHHPHPHHAVPHTAMAAVQSENYPPSRYPPPQQQPYWHHA